MIAIVLKRFIGSVDSTHRKHSGDRLVGIDGIDWVSVLELDTLKSQDLDGWPRIGGID